MSRDNDPTYEQPDYLKDVSEDEALRYMLDDLRVIHGVKFVLYTDDPYIDDSEQTLAIGLEVATDSTDAKAALIMPSELARITNLLESESERTKLVEVLDILGLRHEQDNIGLQVKVNIM